MKKLVSLLCVLCLSAGNALAAETKVAGGAKEAGTTPAPATSAEPKVAKKGDRPIRDKWALVVGIGQFQSDKIPRLKYSAKDASDFYNYLVKEAHFAPDHVRLLLNEKATERRVLSELGSKFLARVVEPDDLVVLFFSTHGSPAQLDLRGANYLVAYDTDPTDLYVSGIDMQKILESIHERVLTDRVLMVMDACHSGGAGTSSKGLKRTGNFDAESLAQGSGQLVICSSMPEEQSWESARYKNGVFTKKLLDGLRSDGPQTKLGEAFKVVEHSVADEVREDRPGVRQTPVLNSTWNGSDLVLASVPVHPQEVPVMVKRDLEPDSGLIAMSIVNATPSPEATEGDSNDGGSNNGGSNNGGSGRNGKNNSSAQSQKQTGVLKLTRAYFAHTGDAKALVVGYGKAIRTNPRDPILFYQRARAHVMLSHWASAFNDLSDALMNDPNRWDCYLLRAFVQHMQGEEVPAREDLAQARFYNHNLPDQIEFAE